MSFTSVRIFHTFLELITCIAALITKKITDARAQQIYTTNQKRLYEWRLLSNLSWSQEGNDLSLVTYGGYTLITSALFLSRIIEYKKNTGLFAKILLVLGIIFFSLQGCLILGAIEHVTLGIQDNAYILACLSFFAAILFFIDAFFLERSVSKQNKSSQTADVPVKANNVHTISSNVEMVRNDASHISRIDETKGNPSSASRCRPACNYIPKHSVKKYLNTAL